MADISYNNFTDTGSWNTTPAQPYNYYNLLSSPVTLPNGDTYITFIDLPVGMTVAGPPATTEPFDSVIFISDYGVEYLFKIETTSYGTIWVDANYPIFSTMAAYTSGGYWAYGNPDGNSPGVLFTGAGNADTPINDVPFTFIDPAHFGSGAPAPFQLSNFVSDQIYGFGGCIPNEIYSNYQVIDSDTIKILNLDTIAPDKKLYVLFNAP